MRDRADPAIFDHSSKRHVAERQQAQLTDVGYAEARWVVD